MFLRIVLQTSQCFLVLKFETNKISVIQLILLLLFVFCSCLFVCFCVWLVGWVLLLLFVLFCLFVCLGLLLLAFFVCLFVVCLFVLLVSLLLFWCDLLTYVVRMIIVKTVSYHLCEKTDFFF